MRPRFARGGRSSAVLLLTMCTAFWAGNTVVGKVAAGYVPPFSLSFWRWVVALAVILPFGWRALALERRWYMRHWRFVFLLALLSVACYNTFQYWALNWTSAINVGVITAILPILIFSLTWFLGHERATGYQVAGVVVSVLGVGVVVCRGDLTILVQLQFSIGDGLILIAVSSWAVYSVLLKKLPSTLNSVGLLTALILFGLIGMLPLLVWDIAHGQYFKLDTNTGIILLYVGIFPSVLAFLFWNRAVEIGGANLAGVLNNLIPIFATALAVVFLGEELHSFHVLGIGLIFVGIYLATLRPASTAS